VKKSFKIQQLLHHKSKHHQPSPCTPSSLTAFQRHQEHTLKHPGLVISPMHPFLIDSFPKTSRTQSEASWFGESHQYKTKQTNKQPLHCVLKVRYGEVWGYVNMSSTKIALET
jgi:hypothetical protein